MDDKKKIRIDSSLLNLHMDKEEIEITKDSNVFLIVWNNKNLRLRVIALIAFIIVIILI